ncbi:MAG: SMC-Scp complex subunit ScpB [Elusimicrobia bacterium RIFOXYC2_FULL_34_12]|nr:MAG: SMC-Scp complex subunit ScpB [Elusimicrobia bacterium RIFOXYC2_FULL_34_12]OGS38792.1 MAG: SMC-Scp complex subunit ScpB [Elusimicrobia bacterium RIFOXYD2_FULL_34_30]HAM37928.1 SMC-Scp complex subunit ScpB [Elusimicrobiota bacterium]
MELKKIVEALLFVTQGPLKIETITQIIGDTSLDEVKQAVSELIKDYEIRQSAIQIVEIAGGLQLSTKRDYAQYIRKLYRDETILKLSASALETLAIVAYRQPITRADIEQIRGVEVSAVLKTLVDKNLVRTCGKKDTVGTPFLYGTTQQFLIYFGLKSTDELPSLEEINVEQEQ